MGFFDGFAKGLKNSNENKKIIKAYEESQEYDNNYRSKAFDNADSNNGWYICAKCGKKFRKKDMDADHILPQSRGGDNSRYNLQILCAHCNRSKQADTSDTAEDLARRRRELAKQDKEDLRFLNNSSRRK